MTECSCSRCETCNDYIGDCAGEECENCGAMHSKCYEIKCDCYCKTCGQLWDTQYDLPCNTPADLERHTWGFPMPCGCEMDWKESKAIKDRVMAEQDERELRRARKERDAEVEARISRWIGENMPEYYDRPRLPMINSVLDNVCGVYALVGRDWVSVFGEKSELLVSSDGARLWGRYRLIDEVHGLFRSSNVPSQASKNPVVSQVAVETEQAWLCGQMPGEDTGEESPNTDGIMFLGAGIIALGDTFHDSEQSKFDRYWFGGKVSDEYKNIDTLKET